MISEESKKNFTTLQRAFSRGDVSIVHCEDSKGRSNQMLCALCHDEPTGTYKYVPFAIMITPSFYPFVNKLMPTSKLKGEWGWEIKNDSTDTKSKT